MGNLEQEIYPNMAPLARGRSNPAVAFGTEDLSKLIVYGGYDGEEFVDIAEIFCIETSLPLRSV